MLLHIANFADSNRQTVTAGADIPLGSVVVASDVAGVRTVNAVGDAQSALLVKGNYGIAFEVSKLQLQVSSVVGTIPADFGTRLVAIKSGDLIAEVKPGAIMEYDVSLLHSSLDPNRSGALPVAGAALGIKGGLFCTVGTASAITSPVVGRVNEVVGGKVRIELL